MLPSVRSIMLRDNGRWLLVAIAIGGLSLTAAATLRVHRDQRLSHERLLEAIKDDIELRIRSHLLIENPLRGTAAMVQVVGGLDVIRFDQFVGFVRSRDVGRDFPGTKGIGLALRVPPGSERRTVSSLKERDWPIPRLWSLGPNQKDRYILIGAYPEDLNANAIGGDVASEEQRAAAIDAAIRTGRPQITAPVTLIPAGNAKSQTGILTFLPIYDGITTPQNEAGDHD